MTAAYDPLSERVLVLAPTRRDAALARTLLADADLPAAIVADLPGLLHALAAGAGAVLLTEEAVRTATSPAGRLDRRAAAWSDMPFVLLTRQARRGPQPGRSAPVAHPRQRRLSRTTVPPDHVG